jgi:hypothetical protein
LALDEHMAVFIADSHATSAAVTVVVGIERAGEPGGGGARVRVGELERLHRGRGVNERTNERSEWVSKSFYDSNGDNSFMLLSTCNRSYVRLIRTVPIHSFLRRLNIHVVWTKLEHNGI